jgi:hypothetical protein
VLKGTLVVDAVTMTGVSSVLQDEHGDVAKVSCTAAPHVLLYSSCAMMQVETAHCPSVPCFILSSCAAQHHRVVPPTSQQTLVWYHFMQAILVAGFRH